MNKHILSLGSIAIGVLLTVSCGQGGQDNTQTANEADTVAETDTNEWEILFDGSSTDKWKSYCGDEFPEGWVIEDGALKVIGSGRGEAGGGGDIVTRETYANFELSLEWKVSEGGNSGIFYLARERCGENAEPIWKSAPEMQILDNEKHPDAKLGIAGNRQACALYDLIPATPQNSKPAGEWNQVTITVYRGTVIHNQNGENVVEYHLWTDEWNNMIKDSKFAEFPDFLDVAQEGYIGLQDHGDDVWFRNIKVKRL